MIEITLYCVSYFVMWCLSAIFISRTSWDDEMAIIGGFSGRSCYRLLSSCGVLRNSVVNMTYIEEELPDMCRYCFRWLDGEVNAIPVTW